MKPRGIALAMLVALLGSSASAYELLGSRWLTAEATIWLDIPSFNGRSDWNAAFVEASELWVPDFAVSIQNSYADPCETGPPRNGVDFRAQICDMVDFGESTLAIALTLSSGGNTIETDIIFNSAKAWDIYSGPDQVANDFRRVAVHEIGHVIGLDHEDSIPAIMSSFSGDLEAPTLDDRSGVQAIYGVPFVPPLLAVAGPRSFIPIGPPGGPFVPAEQEYRIYNLGTEDMVYGISWPSGEYLDVQDSTGAMFTNTRILAGGASTTVKYVLNANAATLTPTRFTLNTLIQNLSNTSGDVDVMAQIRVNIPGDFDLDDVPDASDICPFAVDVGLDSGGVGGTTPDGIGDGCQCGDVSDDGIVDLRDAVLVILDQAGLLPGLVQSIKCSVDGISGCATSDADAIRASLAGLGPLQQSCIAATGTL